MLYRKENFVHEGVWFTMWIIIILMIILIGFAGNIVAMLRTIVKQNDRIISLFENEINNKH
ncbi:hypothetical protein [Bacillus paralicheniformis]|uniref:hypothetical protein n=1 Tax=Bacillus paralicheniformis TaxID=1648923 RepID=UPI002DBF637E|nr:hypothetical protein [Bacillus paralicheniformis]MEC1300652.1 hypothetical protein [Bacillus paralicheniformis]